jgi:glutamate-1-semialdehyde 2,1-aminomutase/spore coat polysaccharide biosynthesis protein SpsF
VSRTAVIVQARTGSTRLPGKVLRKLGAKTVLAHVLDRCASVKGADAVVCATSTLPQDDPVAAEAARTGAHVFRGSESDVLERYLAAARSVDADVVLRVTADCPLIDPDVCAAVIALRSSAGADYASNNMPRLYPHGLDCEAFRVAALAEAAAATSDPFDHEHVTPWLRRKLGLKRANLVGPGWPASMHRWTLDYPEDLDFFSAIFAALPEPETARMQDVLSLLAARPDIAALNAKHRAEASGTGSGSSIVFRCDAGRDIGMGHAMRCAALQDRLAPLGWRCLWAVESATAAFLGIGLEPARTLVLADPEPQAQALEIRRSVAGDVVLVIDRYGTRPEFSIACRDAGIRVLHFDDFGSGELPADLAVTIGANPDRPVLPEPPRRLIGGRYAPLRWQFSRQRSGIMESRAARSTIQRVLIGFGGTDPVDASGLAVEAVLDSGLSCDVAIGGRAQHLPALRSLAAAHTDRVRLHEDVTEVAALMSTADLAIGAPGTGTWERGAMGLPVLLVGIAENQRDNAAVVAATGAGISCGFLNENNRVQIRESFAAAIAALKGEPAKLLAMAQAASGLSDGRGAMRIAAAALPEAKLSDGSLCRFRLIEPEDEALILAWQSAPKTRRYAGNPSVPSAEEHHAWFTAKLRSDADWFLVAEAPEGPAGFIRLDWLGEAGSAPIFLVSIATAPGHYRRGIGRALLAATRHLAPRGKLLAKVLAGNQASRALFESLGYQPGEDGYLVSTAS